MTPSKAISEELSHTMVHYLLTIHKLKEGKGHARVTDIAKDLDLTKGSVSTAIKSLKRKGLVEEEEKGSKFLLLTQEGHDEVHRILSARTLLFYFLRDFVGVTEQTAAKDSCQMEHLMSIETSSKFFDFMKDLACTCKRMDKKALPTRFHFETTLDLCRFDDADDFAQNQEGDKYLASD